MIRPPRNEPFTHTLWYHPTYITKLPFMIPPLLVNYHFMTPGQFYASYFFSEGLRSCIRQQNVSKETLENLQQSGLDALYELNKDNVSNDRITHLLKLTRSELLARHWSAHLIISHLSLRYWPCTQLLSSPFNVNQLSAGSQVLGRLFPNKTPLTAGEGSMVSLHQNRNKYVSHRIISAYTKAEAIHVII